MNYLLINDILHISAAVSVLTGFFWGDKYSVQFYGRRIMRVMFGGTLRSFLVGEIPILIGLSISLLLTGSTAIHDILLHFVGSQIAYLVIGLCLFTNWKVGPFSFAPRHGIRVYWIVKGFEKDGCIIKEFLSAEVESMFWAAKSGNAKSAALLESLRQRDDELGQQVQILVQQLEKKEL